MISASEIEKLRVEKFSISTSLLIRAALEMGLECSFLPEKVVEISNGKKSHLFKGTSLPCNNMVASRLANNKHFLRTLLKRKKMPVPRTLVLRRAGAWQDVLQGSLQFPLVVKPVNASHANGSAFYLTTPKELELAVRRAFAYIKRTKREPKVLVEEFFEGQDLRLFVVGNKVVSTLRREPAYVIGDGERTIRQLIDEFNREWRSPIKYDFPLCPVPIDIEVRRYLALKKLTLSSVLPAGEKSYLRWNANVSTGGRAIDISSQVHPRIKKLAVEIAKMSHIEVGGIDLLCKNPQSADVTSANVSILEINDSPGLDIHHLPFEGEGKDISTSILRHIFGRSLRKKPDSIEQLLKDLHVSMEPVSPSEVAFDRVV